MRWTYRYRRACDSDAYGQAVWSCPLDAGVNPRVKSPGGRRLTSPTLRGERGAAVKPLRRECRSDFGVPVLACVRLFLLCTQGSGCGVHPAFPAPSVFPGGTPMMQSPDAKSRRGKYERMPMNSVVTPCAHHPARAAPPVHRTPAGRWSGPRQAIAHACETPAPRGCGSRRRPPGAASP